MKIVKELCIGSIDDVKNCYDNWSEIDRFETCSGLEYGGLTPEIETFKYIKENTNKDQVVMIRNKNSFYIEDTADILIMQNQIEKFIKLGAKAVVFGYLNKNNNSVDEFTCSRLITVIKKYSNVDYVFHMAIDQCEDYDIAFKSLIKLGFKRVLTRGGKTPAENNIQKLKYLNDTYGNQIEILVGGRVTYDNYQRICQETNVKQVHGKKIVKSN